MITNRLAYSQLFSSAQLARISAFLQLQRLRQPALISPLLRFPPLFHIPPVQLPIPDPQAQVLVTADDGKKEEKDENEENNDLDVV